VHGTELTELPEAEFEHDDCIIEAHGAVIGHTRLVRIARFIYVSPDRYGQLNQRDRYAVAALIGKINRAKGPAGKGEIMLLGPGRWGTSMPSLGVPVNFGDINRVSVLCEIVAMHEGLIPDASLGTHFLNELVEMDTLYLALYPSQGSNYLGTTLFENSPNRLTEIVPSAARWLDTVYVVESADLISGEGSVMLAADAQKQEVVCFRSPQ